MTLLFDIPEDISINLLSQWCNLDDLGRLDTACCSVKERSFLLMTFCSPGFDLHANVTLRGMRFCVDKGMAMKSVWLCRSDFKADRHRNIVLDTLNTQKIDELQILKDVFYEYSIETVIFCYQFANQCNALERLMLFEAFDNCKHVDMFITFLSIDILRNLKVIYNQSNFGFKSYRYLAKHCKLLESVSVYNIDVDTNELDIQSLLINNCMSLKNIYLYYHALSNLTNKTVQCVIDHCPKIEKLYLGYNNEVSVSLTLVNQLLTKCTALTAFRVGNAGSLIALSQNNNKTSNILILNPLTTNEHELVQLFAHVKQKNLIQIVSVPLLSTTTLNTIALYNSNSLERLHMLGCPLITTVHVIKLISALPKLTHLSAAHCSLVEEQVVKKYWDDLKKS